MSVRKASPALQRVPALPPLVEREPPAAEPEWGALEWQGSVRIAIDRASGLSAPSWQRHVRTGLLERALVLGADHREGPHLERPEAGRRLLAHIDALAEAGLSFAELSAFAEEAELDHPGALWVLTILFGCLDIRPAEDAFEDWVASLDASLFSTYRGVVEIAEALAVQPSPLLRGRAERWVESSSDVLCAIALETTPAEHLSRDLSARVTQAEGPLVQAATERLLLRAPKELHRPTSMKDSWLDWTVPALSYEVARARILHGDPEPLVRLRERDVRVVAALGPHALDVIALAGDGRDDDLAGSLAWALPTTPPLLDAMGRAGLPSLFPRLLAELGSDDFDEEAHRALATALGDEVARPSVTAWEQAIAALPRTTEATRIRWGKPYALQSLIEEMKRQDLSAKEIRIRADEVFVSTGRSTHADWGAFGISLENVVSDLARLAS